MSKYATLAEIRIVSDAARGTLAVWDYNTGASRSSAQRAQRAEHAAGLAAELLAAIEGARYHVTDALEKGHGWDTTAALVDTMHQQLKDAARIAYRARGGAKTGKAVQAAARAREIVQQASTEVLELRTEIEKASTAAAGGTTLNIDGATDAELLEIVNQIRRDYAVTVKIGN